MRSMFCSLNRVLLATNTELNIFIVFSQTSSCLIIIMVLIVILCYLEAVMRYFAGWAGSPDQFVFVNNTENVSDEMM